MKSKLIKDRGIFASADSQQKVVLSREVYEMSKLIELQDHSLESVIFEAGDECTGLYILQKGTIGGYILDHMNKH